MWRHTILCNLLPLFIPGRKRSTVRIPSNRHREFEYDDIVFWRHTVRNLCPE